MKRNIKAGFVSIGDNGLYHDIVKKRDVRNVMLHKTAILQNPEILIANPAIEEEVTTWRPASKLWRISEVHYGEGRFYWIIGLYNDKPTDAHWEVGDTVYIPKPLSIVRQILEY